MTKKFNRGFTLIELLVVIAIIGILSSVVLASLNTARGKGANAAIKSNLNNMRAQAEIIYDGVTPNSYDTVCDAVATIQKGVTAAATAAGATTDFTLASVGGPTVAVCHSGGNPSAWAVSSPLKNAEGTSIYWCVDTTGTSGGRINTLATNETVCPAT